MTVENLKSWAPIWSNQLNSAARQAHLPKNEANWSAQQGCLADSLKTDPRILIFSILIGADYSSKLKSMPIWVLAFCTYNNLCLGRVYKIINNHLRCKKRANVSWQAPTKEARPKCLGKGGNWIYTSYLELNINSFSKVMQDNFMYCNISPGQSEGLIHTSSDHFLINE